MLKMCHRNSGTDLFPWMPNDWSEGGNWPETEEEKEDGDF